MKCDFWYRALNLRRFLNERSGIPGKEETRRSAHTTTDRDAPPIRICSLSILRSIAARMPPGPAAHLVHLPTRLATRACMPTYRTQLLVLLRRLRRPISFFLEPYGDRDAPALLYVSGNVYLCMHTGIYTRADVQTMRMLTFLPMPIARYQRDGSPTAI